MDNKIMKITIKEGAKEETVHGRLIGFVTDAECKAIINTPDAPRKICSSESILPSSHTGQKIGRRIVFVTYELGDAKDFSKKIFISPVITNIAYIAGDPEYTCGAKTFSIKAQDGGADV